MGKRVEFEINNINRLTFGKFKINEFTVEELEARKKHFMNLIITLPSSSGLLEAALREYKYCDDAIALKSAM